MMQILCEMHQTPLKGFDSLLTLQLRVGPSRWFHCKITGLQTGDRCSPVSPNLLTCLISVCEEQTRNIPLLEIRIQNYYDNIMVHFEVDLSAI